MDLKSNLTKKLSAAGVITMLLTLPASLHAQSSKAKQALTKVTTELTGIYDTVANLAYAIAAIMAVVGVIVVGVKINQGDNQSARHIAGWFTCIIFIVLAIGVVIKAFFV